MKAYIGKFIKKNGSERVMTFCRLEDVPSDFLESTIKGNRANSNLSDGMELVWSLEDDAFRTFNHYTMIGELLEIEVDDLFEVVA